jgi:hypothetical protein
MPTMLPVFLFPVFQLRFSCTEFLNKRQLTPQGLLPDGNPRKAGAHSQARVATGGLEQGHRVGKGRAKDGEEFAGATIAQGPRTYPREGVKTLWTGTG